MNIMAIEIPLTYTKDALLAKLTDLRPVMEKRDKATIAQHRKDEAAYLKRFHAACREALKWDYETAKAHRFGAEVREPSKYGGTEMVRPPKCPAEETNQLERVIALIDRTDQRRFNINQFGKYGEVYALLTADIKPAKDVCE